MAVLDRAMDCTCGTRETVGRVSLRRRCTSVGELEATVAAARSVEREGHSFTQSSTTRAPTGALCTADSPVKGMSRREQNNNRVLHQLAPSLLQQPRSRRFSICPQRTYRIFFLLQLSQALGVFCLLAFAASSSSPDPLAALSLAPPPPAPAALFLFLPGLLAIGGLLVEASFEAARIGS